MLGLEEKPDLQALARALPRQGRQAGGLERREVESQRHGTVTLGVARNVSDGTRRGWGIDKTDQEPFWWWVRQGARPYHRARRRQLSMDNGGSPIAHPTATSFATPPPLRVVYTPAHARWLNQAELLLRACTDKYRDRFDWASRQQLIAHLKASWPEYNRRFAHPFDWSWTRRDLYAWAEKKGTAICTKTYATVH